MLGAPDLAGAWRTCRGVLLFAVLAAAVTTAALLRFGKPASAASNEPFQPCPGAGEPCRILPLGDSITWGIGYEGGYRVALFERARAAGKQLTFTGSLENGPTLLSGTPFPRRHQGVSGWTVEQVMTTVPVPALQTMPHIVLLHAGTNDMYARTNVSRIAERLDALIERLEKAAPAALIVVAEILPLTDPELREAARQYNAEVRRRVQARAARGEHVLLVDQFSGFSTALLRDGVHPTQAGYELMAERWYTAIAPYLP